MRYDEREKKSRKQTEARIREPKITSKYLVKFLPEDIVAGIHNGTFPSSFTEHGYTDRGHGDRITRRQLRDGTFVYYRTLGSTSPVEEVPTGVSGVVKEHMEIEPEEFEILWQQTEGHRVAKRGYNISSLGEGSTIYLDIFEGDLGGRMLLNLEFSSVEQASQFQAPYWFGSNSTTDISSRSLAIGGSSVAILNESAQFTF